MRPDNLCAHIWRVFWLCTLPGGKWCFDIPFTVLSNLEYIVAHLGKFGLMKNIFLNNITNSEDKWLRVHSWYIYDADLGFCAPCQQGTFRNDLDVTSCTTCPKGQTTEGVGHSSCSGKKTTTFISFYFFVIWVKNTNFPKDIFVNQMLPVHLGKSTSGSKRVANCVSLVSKIISFSFKIKKMDHFIGSVRHKTLSVYVSATLFWEQFKGLVGGLYSLHIDIYSIRV